MLQSIYKAEFILSKDKWLIPLLQIKSVWGLPYNCAKLFIKVIISSQFIIQMLGVNKVFIMFLENNWKSEKLTWGVCLYMQLRVKMCFTEIRDTFQETPGRTAEKPYYFRDHSFCWSFFLFNVIKETNHVYIAMTLDDTMLTGLMNSLITVEIFSHKLCCSYYCVDVYST